MSTNTTPYETAEEALEGRIRSMGYSLGHVVALAAELAAVRARVEAMQADDFPTEYGILEPIIALERSATLQAEPKIAAFMSSYQSLLAKAEDTSEEEPTS